MKSIKVACLASADSIHTVRWVNEMTRWGHQVHLITMLPPAEHNSIDNAVEIHLLPFPAPTGYFLNKWQLKRLLKRIKPDLLHTHYASGYGTLSRLSDFHPTLLSVWGSDVFVFPYQAKWKEKILRLNLAAADYIASTSHIMKQQTEKFVAPKHPITITPFGVDCEKFKLFNEFKNSDEFIVGTVKGLEENYGIEYLIRAFAILKKNYQGAKQLKLLIAGIGSLENQLKTLTAELGIANETEFLGYVPNSDVPKILNRFSVSVCVSVSESFGVAVIEASSCGIPVVVSDVGGLPEIVKNNETGFIVDSKNPEATASAIMKLIEDPELKKRMGTAGRNYVLKNYEWNENASRMKKLYQIIMSTV
jgi:L-malate glycosyltransferase